MNRACLTDIHMFETQYEKYTHIPENVIILYITYPKNLM